MTVKKLTIAWCLYFAYSIMLNAQTQRCHTTEYEEFILATHPEFEAIRNSINEAVSAYIRDYDTLTQRSVPPSNLTIPVVVHLIGDNAIALAQTKVQEQIDILNNDFRKVQGTLGFGAGVDTKIQFCLAITDPDSNPTNGILPFSGTDYPPLWKYDAPDSDSNSDKELKSISHWAPEKYLNLYVADLCCGVLGYATFPWELSVSPNQDGVVIDSDYFGINSATNSLGRTCTHEVGHWLGLKHTFHRNAGETTCKNNDCDKNGDEVCDTPPVWNNNSNPKGPNFDCTPDNTCQTDNDDPAYPFPDKPDLIENYMDYTDDNCMNMFTNGQSVRMWSFLNTVRSYSGFTACTDPQHCTNNMQDADETGIDCGGADCNPCSTTGGAAGGSCRYYPQNPMLINGYYHGTNGGWVCVNKGFLLQPGNIKSCGEPKWQLVAKEIRFFTCPFVGNLDYSKCTKNLVIGGTCTCFVVEYFVEIVEVDQNKNQIGPAYSSWFSQQLDNTVYYNPSSISVDANMLSKMQIGLQYGKYYKIKLATATEGWKSGESYFQFVDNDIVKSGIVQNNLYAAKDIHLSDATVNHYVDVVAGQSVHIKPNSSLKAGRYRLDDIDCPNYGMKLHSQNETIAQDSYVIGMPMSKSNMKKDSLTVINSSVTIYPNPNDGQFTVELSHQSKNNSTLSLMDLTGRTLIYHSNVQSLTIIDLSNYSKGIYFVQIQQGEEITVKKVVYQ